MQIVPECYAPGNAVGVNVNSLLDVRQSLVNQGEIGPIESISVPADEVGQQRGVLFDIDIRLLRRSSIIPVVPQTPRQLYPIVAPWLSRHPALAKAEVRNSGQGLHVILWLNEPIVFGTPGDRDRWAAMVKVIQAALPIDPDQPGITAITRAIGSRNSKNDAIVETLRLGSAVREQDLLCLYDDMCERPFRTLFQVLVGGSSATPCPICHKPSSRLSALDRVGLCYGSCGRVSLVQLYDLVLLPRDRAKGV